MLVEKFYKKFNRRSIYILYIYIYTSSIKFFNKIFVLKLSMMCKIIYNGNVFVIISWF